MKKKNWNKTEYILFETNTNEEETKERANTNALIRCNARVIGGQKCVYAMMMNLNRMLI